LTSLLELIDQSAASTCSVVFDDSTPERVSAAELMRRSASKRNWFATRFEPGETVGMLLTASPACIESLLGAWHAGLRVASLPIPARGASLAAYATQLGRLLETTTAREMFAEGSYCELLTIIGVDATPFESLHDSRARSNRDGAALLQFTSGTTGHPKAVCLGLDAVASNIEALLERIDPGPGDVSASWLPLSHDMGLVGMALSSWVAAAKVGKGELFLMKPEQFVADPGSWMRLCSSARATITAAPDFAMRLASRFARRERPGTLASLRCVITGAEPVRASTLHEFQEAFGQFGLRSSALCPAYGMAEVALGATLSHLDRPPRELSLHDAADELQMLGIDPALGGERFLVSCGPALSNTRVTITPEGSIAIDSPSLLDGYITEKGFETASNPFVSRDLGFLRDDELYVLGRHDDLLIVAGRKLFARDLEDAVEAIDGVRGGGCIAVGTASGSIAVVIESAVGADEVNRLQRTVRSLIVERFAVSPSEIRIIGPDELPKTPSGKKQRHLAWALIERV